MVSYEPSTLLGFLETVDDDSNQTLVRFHRNDFKNRFWIHRLLIASEIEFNVLTVSYKRNLPKLIYVDNTLLNGVRDIFKRIRDQRIIINMNS